MNINYSGFTNEINESIKAKKLTTWQKQAFKIHELACQLEMIADDDEKEVTDYTLIEVLNEAEECLYMYTSEGSQQYEEYKGNCVESSHENAKKQVKLLKKLIKDFR